MTGRRLMVVVVVLCLSAGAASAEWQRTVRLADPLTPDQGRLQTELEGWYGDAGDWNETDTRVSLALYYGLLENLSLEARAHYRGYDTDGGTSESGLGDTVLRSRFRFLDESKSGVDLAAFGYVSLPTGDDDKWLGNGDVEPGLGLTAAKTFNQVVMVAEAYYNVITDADVGEEDGQLYVGLEGALMVNDQFNVNAFVDTEAARWEEGDDESYAGIGARFLPQPGWELLGRLALGLSDSFYDWIASVTVGREF